MNNRSDDITGEQLLADFKVVVADAEALLKATANQGDEKLAEIRAKAEESLKVAKARMNDAQAALLLKSREAAKAADVYVHQNPWEAIGVAAGLGVLVGFLISRR
jgi:ElaB/YqjD/DUF883 family membrane-anchored ribosome-binding protein